MAGGAKAGVRSAIVTEGVSEYFSVTETAQRPLQEGLKKDTSAEQTAHFKPDLLVNKISLFYRYSYIIRLTSSSKPE